MEIAAVKGTEFRRNLLFDFRPHQAFWLNVFAAVHLNVYTIYIMDSKLLDDGVS